MLTASNLIIWYRKTDIVTVVTYNFIIELFNVRRRCPRISHRWCSRSKNEAKKLSWWWWFSFFDAALEDNSQRIIDRVPVSLYLNENMKLKNYIRRARFRYMYYFIIIVLIHITLSKPEAILQFRCQSIPNKKSEYRSATDCSETRCSGSKSRGSISPIDAQLIRTQLSVPVYWSKVRDRDKYGKICNFNTFDGWLTK